MEGSKSTNTLEDWIRSGIERDERYTPEEIIDGIAKGEFQLFVYPEGLIVTQISGHNRLLVFLISGSNLEAWKELATRDLESYAESLGIDVIEAYCRPGLERMLRDVGFVKEQVVLRKRKAPR